MQQIKLDPKYVPLVQSRQKTQTIRFGRRKYNLGDAFFVADGVHIPITIEEVEYVPARKLDIIDAKRYGFDTLKQLKDALLKHYPRMNENNWVTVVAFELKRH